MSLLPTIYKNKAENNDSSLKDSSKKQGTSSSLPDSSSVVPDASKKEKPESISSSGKMVSFFSSSKKDSNKKSAAEGSGKVADASSFTIPHAEEENNNHPHHKQYEKPLYCDSWIRSLDYQQNIYYYNTATGESTWLMPCSICYLNAEKFCMKCAVSYCEKHYTLKHKQYTTAIEKADHTWSPKEVDVTQETLKDPQTEEYCIECHLKIATKLCDTCWDPYCNRCFHLVHHVGALKEHKAMNYHRAKQTWYVVKRPGNNSNNNNNKDQATSQQQQPLEYYVNGATGESTYEKPVELMNELEKVLTENFLTHQQAAEGYIATIADLQFEVEKARFERDQLMIENASLVQGGGAAGNGKGGGNNKRSGGMFGAKSTKNGAESDEPTAAVSVPLATRMLKEELDPYKQKLLNPNDRKRGEARTNYIKSLIDAPV